MIDLHVVLLYLGSSLATFSLAFVKAFQSRNIVHGHHKAAFFTSWGVSSLEVAGISFVVMGGWYTLISAGIGGSIGTVVAMKAHARIFKRAG